jgi:hypothetical protein
MALQKAWKDSTISDRFAYVRLYARQQTAASPPARRPPPAARRPPPRCARLLSPPPQPLTSFCMTGRKGFATICAVQGILSALQTNTAGLKSIIHCARISSARRWTQHSGVIVCPCLLGNPAALSPLPNQGNRACMALSIGWTMQYCLAAAWALRSSAVL